MKYLKPFNEGLRKRDETLIIPKQGYTEDDKRKVESIVNQLKYIIEDEGYWVTLNTPDPGNFTGVINVIIDKVVSDGDYNYENSLIGDDITEEYDEFFNRLIDSLSEFTIISDEGKNWKMICFYKIYPESIEPTINESKDFTTKEKQKIKSVFDEFKYILQDEGYSAYINTAIEIKPVIIIIQNKRNMVPIEDEEFFDEFYDRLENSLPEFEIKDYISNRPGPPIPNEAKKYVRIIAIYNKKKAINESKSEKRNIVRTIVKDIINIFKTKGPGNYNLPENSDIYDFDNLKTAFNVELKVIKDENMDKFDLDGGFYVDEDMMEIEITYNPKDFPGELYNLVGGLNEIVRHELQHLMQYQWGEDQTQDSSSPENYYSKSHEIDAQVAGFKRISKLKKQPFEQSVIEWFDRNKESNGLGDEEVKRIIKKIIDHYKGEKTFESSNNSFTFGDILRDVQDDFTSVEFSSDIETDFDKIELLHNSVVKSGTDIRYYLDISNEGDGAKSYGDAYPYLEEIVSRMEDKNAFLQNVILEFVTKEFKYVSLPDPSEISPWRIKIFKSAHDPAGDTISKLCPTGFRLQFRIKKRNLEPTTKFGKFIDRFRDKTQTKYTTYSDDTGPG